MRASRFRLVRLAAAMAVVAVVVPACGGGDASSAPPSGSEAVSFETADGVEIDGRLFGEPGASAGLVLAHMSSADQTSLYGLAETLVDEGYRALTFDFRGYCPGGDAGCSGGEARTDLMWQDVQAAVRFLRSQGVPRVGAIGASMGGTAALVAVSKPRTDIEAVVALSAQSIDGFAVGPEGLAVPTTAKLYVAGNGDPGAAAAAQELYDQSAPPKRVEIFPSEDHGSDLLEGNQGPNVRYLLIRWLAEFLPVGSSGQGPS